MPLSPTSPNTTVVTAPAGSGKTTLLVQHYLRHLKTTPIERIVAITFTRKAAAELLARVADVLRDVVDPRQSWEKQRAIYAPFAPDARRAREALASLDSAPVGTVDSFVLALLQEHVLHAHLPLEKGRRAYLDAPIESGGGTVATYEAAAREVLERLSDEARVLLQEMSLGEAIVQVGALAATRLTEALGARELLEALALALAGEIATDPEPWKEPAPAMSPSDEAGVEFIRRLVRGTNAGQPPLELVAYFARNSKAAKFVKELRVRALAQALRALKVPGVASNDYWIGESRKALLAFGDGASLDRADAVRDALLALARQARLRAHEAMGRGAGRGYDELLFAATELCRNPPETLRHRFDALMVDEVQDTNPGQLAFYRAFAGMRGSPDGLKAFFVGDTRQSIYRFRQADPFGWLALVEEADEAGTRASLTVNRRSSKLLVEVQRTVFRELALCGERGVELLDDVQAAEEADAGLLADAGWRAPVVVVSDEVERTAEPAAIAAFAKRLLARRNKHPGESAAVLVRSWNRAQSVAAALRAYGIEAQLTGERTLLATRIAADVRTFLAALLDITDDIALAAVLKHPSVGISDRGLMLLRAGGGFARLFAPEPDLLALAADDKESLTGVLPLLIEARQRLGRESTAGVLEWLVASLHWRPIIAAGPEGGGGEGVAQLDVLLELVRQAERDVVDPFRALEALTPEGAGDDVPVIRMHRGSDTVTVTTTFAAKGLEFDHVLLLQVGEGGDDGSMSQGAFTLYRPVGAEILGLKLDPEGGLSPRTDPVAELGAVLCDGDSRQEAWRLFYVGLTRARRSVVLGLGKGDDAGIGPTSILRRIFIEDSKLGEAVEAVPASDVEVKAPVAEARGRTSRISPFLARWAEPKGWSLVRPSASKGAATRRSGLVLRGSREVPAVETANLLTELSESTLGSLVHGWMQWWGMKGEPSEADARAYLEQEWTEAPPGVADWLVGTGLAVRDGIPGLRELLLPHALDFETPVILFDADRIVAGRTDLLVHLGEKRVVILDFKAGSSVPADIANVKGEYVAQLETYARVLEVAGYQVVEVGLVYTRQPTWVRWERVADAGSPRATREVG